MPNFVVQYDLDTATCQTTTLQRPQSTEKSDDCSELMAASGTSNLVGGPTIKERGDSTPKLTRSRMQWKVGSESASFPASTTNKGSTLSLSADDQTHALKRKTVADPPIVVTKRKKRQKGEITEIHRMLREAADNCDKWHFDLETEHGFTEGESCECFSIVAKYLKEDTVPDNATHCKLFDHAKRGWVLMRELDRLIKKHPLENMDQTKVNGEWKMVWWSFEYATKEAT